MKTTDFHGTTILRLVLSGALTLIPLACGSSSPGTATDAASGGTSSRSGAGGATEIATSQVGGETGTPGASRASTSTQAVGGASALATSSSLVIQNGGTNSSLVGTRDPSTSTGGSGTGVIGVGGHGGADTRSSSGAIGGQSSSGSTAGMNSGSSSNGPTGSVGRTVGTAGPYHWNNVAIVGGGYVPGVVFSPVEKDLIYVRTDMGGAYRWDPGASRWIALTDWVGFDDWNYLGIESIAPDPREPKRVYMAVGTYTNGWTSLNGQILRSNDRGDSFERFNLPFKVRGQYAGSQYG